MMQESQSVIQATRYMGNDIVTAAGERLIVMENGEVREYELEKMNKDRLFFGRDPSVCDIVLSNAAASRVHGKIKLAGGKVYVADLESKNGCYVYGQNFGRMEPKKYYVKDSTDFIIKIQGMQQTEAGQTIVLIFTKTAGKSVWKSIDFSSVPQGAPITIGRARDNVLVMDSPSFSRRHAAISRNGAGYAVFDNRSMNGVFVNGNRIEGQAMIVDTDIIQIAGKIFIPQGGRILYEDVGNGISLSLANICKEVGSPQKRKLILNHVFCDIESNEFVAIIGGSGAGKTTVMNAMSGFDPQITGAVLCNGIDLRKNFSALKNMIGFVPQQDIIYENLTLYKMLYFTAKLKMPSDTTAEERERRIAQVLQMVDLQAHADTYIRKLSGGQKKRASIAVELLADPGLFFLDEPTSGLDPDTEQSLMHTLSKLSKTEGKTIIMVTHTTQSIELCDKIIFMAPGGRICYCGSPKEILAYFGKKSLVEIYNELASNGKNWNQYYLQNYMAAKNQQVMGMQAQTESQSIISKVNQRNSKQVSGMKQLGVLTSRYFQLIWNDKQRLILLLLQPLLIALLLKVVAQGSVFKKYEPTKSIMFALTCSGIWIGLFNTIQEICKERPILKREYMGNLKLHLYMLSKFLVQGVLCVVQSAVITTVFLLTMKHAPTKPVLFPAPQLEIWVSMFLVVYASAAMGFIISALVKNGDRAMAIAPFVLIIQLLFSGVLFELKGAADKISYITVSRYGMECLGCISRLNKIPSEHMIPNTNQVMDHDKLDMFKHTMGHLVQTWWILVFIAVLCGVISAVVLRSLKNEQR